VLWLPVTAAVIPCLPNLVTLIVEAMRYSEMLVPTRGTRRNIPEDGILHMNIPICFVTGQVVSVVSKQFCSFPFFALFRRMFL
jgi:hypothetical protein